MPRVGGHVVGEQSAEGRLQCPVLHRKGAGEDLAPEDVDGVSLDVHAHLVVKDELGPAHGSGVVRDQGPLVPLNVVHVEVTLEALGAPGRGVEVAAQREDLLALGIQAHLVARTCAGATLRLGVPRQARPEARRCLVRPEVCKVLDAVPSAKQVQGLGLHVDAHLVAPTHPRAVLAFRLVGAQDGCPLGPVLLVLQVLIEHALVGCLLQELLAGREVPLLHQQLVQPAEQGVLQLHLGPLLQGLERLAVVVLPEVLQAQPDRLFLPERAEPAQGGEHQVPVLVALKLHVPDAEVETGTPRLDGHYFDVTRRKLVATDGVLECECFRQVVILQATVQNFQHVFVREPAINLELLHVAHMRFLVLAKCYCVNYCGPLQLQDQKLRGVVGIG